MSDSDWDLSEYCRICWYKVLRPPPLHAGHRDDRGPISLAGPGPPNTLRRLWWGFVVILWNGTKDMPKVSFGRLDWIEQGLTSQSTHFRSFRRRWGDCGISQDCSRSQIPQCVRCWV